MAALSAVSALRTDGNFMSVKGNADKLGLVGKEFVVDIRDLNNLGAGVGRLPVVGNGDGLVVFVRGTVSGDVAQIEIIKETSSFCVGRLIRIVTPSPVRDTEKFCSAPEACGGCVYRHVTYAHELECKKQRVIRAFRVAGIADANVLDVLSTGKTRGYRNKGMYPVAQGKNGMYSGFFASKSHKLIPAENCSLQPEIFSNIVRAVCDFCNKNAVKAYDEISGKGLLRHIYLRATAAGEVMLCLVINAEDIGKALRGKLIEYITERFPAVTGILLNVNKKSTNVVLGDKFLTVWGQAYIEDVLCGKILRIAPESFYQVNRDAAELLYNTAADMADLTGKEHLLDLYCGAGSIGISMSDKVKSITGIEIVPEAVECAKLNASLNGLSPDRARFFAGDATDADRLLSAAEGGGAPKADIAVIDPPRKGTTRELIEAIAKRNINRVVYISCEPETLARDCAVFRELGYQMSDVQPVDLFPRTGHVESVVCLTRRLDN